MDIVEMLRMCNDNISNEAAATIERLRLENAVLMDAVRHGRAMLIKRGVNNTDLRILDEALQR